MYTRLNKGLNLLKVESLINKSSCCVLTSLSTNHHKILKSPSSSQFLHSFKKFGLKTEWTPTDNLRFKDFQIFLALLQIQDRCEINALLSLVQHSGDLGFLRLT